MNSTQFYAVSALFNGLFGVFVVYYVFLRNKQNPINRSFLYFGIAVSGWSLIYSLWAFAPDAQIAEFYIRRHMMFESFIPATFFHFSCQFTKKFEKYRKAVVLFYILAFGYFLSTFTSSLVAGVQKQLFFDYWPKPGVLLLSHLVYFGAAMAFGLFNLGRFIFQTSGRERDQALWIFTAVLIGFGGGSVNWLLWFGIPVAPTSNFFVGLMFALIAYAIVKHGLMDADMVLELVRASRASAMGMMAGSISHELRNPLYIAKGKIETYLELSGDNKNRGMLEESLRQHERAMDIIKRFSGFMRSSANEKKEKVYLNEVAEDVIEFLSREVENKKVKIENSLNGAVIFAVKGQIEEILFNLILNACQALEEKGGAISLKGSKINNKTVIAIKDTGPGIPGENLNRIFEPLYTTKLSRGTGLGLYITKQLVERNGGRIAVKSKPGEGSEFTVEFFQKA